MPINNQRKSYILAILACLLWSTIATAFVFGLREMDGLQLMLGASAVASFCLLLILTITKRLTQLKMVRWCHLRRAAFLGLLNPFLYYAVLMKAYELLPAQEAMALNYTWPVMLVLFSIPVLGQRIGWRSILALMISFAGVLVIGTQGNLDVLRLTNPIGDSLALGSSVLWALYWVYNVKFSAKELPAPEPKTLQNNIYYPCDISKVMISLIFGTAYLFVVTLIFSDIKIPQARGLMAIVYIGIFELGITFVIWLKALNLSTTTDSVSQIAFFSPFMSLLWIRLILKEEIMPATLVGLGLIIGGVFIQKTFAKTIATASKFQRDDNEGLL